MKKQHAWPEGAWNWPIKVCHKHAVRCGEMIWVGGQVNLTPQGDVNNPTDVPAQTKEAMHHFARALEALECDLEDVVWLLCFYVNDGSLNEQDFLSMVGACLPDNARVAVNAVPVPALAYPGLAVEIEGYAMRRSDGERTEKFVAENPELQNLPAPFCQAVRSGKMIFVSGQYPRSNTGEVVEAGNIVNQTHHVMGLVDNVAGLNDFPGIAAGVLSRDKDHFPRAHCLAERGGKVLQFRIFGDELLCSLSIRSAHRIAFDLYGQTGIRKRWNRHGIDCDACIVGQAGADHGEKILLVQRAIIHVKAKQPHDIL